MNENSIAILRKMVAMPSRELEAESIEITEGLFDVVGRLDGILASAELMRRNADNDTLAKTVRDVAFLMREMSLTLIEKVQNV